MCTRNLQPLRIEVSDSEMKFKGHPQPLEQQNLKSQALNLMQSNKGDGAVDNGEWRFVIGEQYGSKEAMAGNMLWLSPANLAAHHAQQAQDPAGNMQAAFNEVGEVAKRPETSDGRCCQDESWFS